MKLNSTKAQEQKRIQERTWAAFRKAAKDDQRSATAQPPKADYWPEPGIAG